MSKSFLNTGKSELIINNEEKELAKYLIIRKIDVIIIVQKEECETKTK